MIPLNIKILSLSATSCLLVVLGSYGALYAHIVILVCHPKLCDLVLTTVKGSEHALGKGAEILRQG